MKNALRPALLLLVSGLLAPAQSPEITVEWIFSGGPGRIEDTPDCRWLAGGDLLIATGDGGLERLDPESGERRPWLDAARAGKAIGEAVGAKVASLPPPTGISRDGRRAFWSAQNRLVVLELPEHEVVRVVAGEEGDRLHRFSPDARRIAFLRNNDLWVHDLEEGRASRLTHDGSETILNGTLSWVYWEELFGRQDIGYWWSDDGTALAFLRSDQSMVDEVHFLDFQPEVPRVLTQRYPKAGSTNPVVRLGIAELEGEHAGNVTWVDLGKNDQEYIVRAKWLPDSRRISVQTLTRDHRKLDLWFADRATGEGRHVLEETDPGWVNVHDDLWFLKDGRHFLWVSERSGYGHIYRYTLDGELVNQVTRGSWSVKGSTPIFWLRQAVAGIDEKRGRVYFGAVEHDPLAEHLYRIGLDGGDMTRLTEEEGAHSIQMSPDARYYLDLHSSIVRPPSLSLHMADRGAAIQVLSPARTREVEELDLVMPELFTVETDDGVSLPAWIYKPHGFDPEAIGPDNRPLRHPVILYTYGGPSSRTVTDSWDFDRWFNQILVRNGYVVCCVDNRSATGRSKTLENTVAGHMTGSAELGDLLCGVRWLRSQPWVDAARIGIWGWSNGAMMTLLGMTRSDAFKAGIAVAPVTRWQYYDTIWTETVNKTPEENPEGYEECDLVRRAKDLHGRLFLVHGTYDDNVHIQNTWAFVDELLKAGKMFDVMIYPMRKHGISDAPARVHLFKRMVEFWKAHL